MKGKAQPVHAFDLLGDGARSRERSIPETPFVGRSQEVALLEKSGGRSGTWKRA